MIDTAPEVLARAKTLVEPALATALTRLHPDVRRATEYHLGWVDVRRASPTGGGKGIRPALAVLSAEAVGADARGRRARRRRRRAGAQLLAAARRHHRRRPRAPAPARRCGRCSASGPGCSSATRCTPSPSRCCSRTRRPRPRRSAAAGHVGGGDDRRPVERHGLREPGASHVDDCRRDGGGQDRRPARLRRVVGAPCWPAPTTAPSTPSTPTALHLGLAFQAVDDLLGIWGSPAVTGKPVGSDLTSKKKTLPIALAMAADAAAADELSALFRNGPLDEAAVARATAADRGRRRPRRHRRAGPRAAGRRPRRARGRRPRADGRRASWPRSPTSSATGSDDRDGRRRPQQARRGGRHERLPPPEPPADPIRTALDRGAAALLAAQHPDGWWKGELQTNVTIDAEDLLLREFLGIRTAEHHRRTAHVDPLAAARRRHLGHVPRRARRPVDHGRGLRRAAPGRRPGRRRPHGEGGRVRPRCRRPRAGPGLHPDLARARRACGRGTTCPALPPEVMLLPPGCPLNIYDFACWARQTIVALTVVAAHRPVPTPAVRARRAAAPARRRRRATRCGRPPGASSCSTACCTATSAAHRGWLRRAALDRAVALDRRPPGGRRLVGRHPAAVGVLADRPAPRGLPARPPGDEGRASTGSTASPSTTSTAGASRPASRRCGTPRWP